jgi:hypothetical protein
VHQLPSILATESLDTVLFVGFDLVIIYLVADSLPGCRLTAQAALVELLESAGLPPVCVAVAYADEKHYRLGEVLAEVVKVCTRIPVLAWHC